MTAATESQAATPEELEKKKKKKKDKVRSAWISFVGRILAQIMGAVATISLGLMVVHQYQSPKRAESSAPATQTESQPRPAATRLATPGDTSIAVLPLDTYARDKQEYFADGMTEAVIAALSRVKGLHVISRTSSMQYKEQRKTLPEIARELDVDLIVEASVTRDRDRVRITVQLIDGKRDEHLWAESYDRTLRDVLSVQSEIAAAIARRVSSTIAPNGRERRLHPEAATPALYQNPLPRPSVGTSTAQ
jgi:TolB-like protein